MGKTGGGRGTNQHKVRGRSIDSGAKSEPEVTLSAEVAATSADFDWDALLEQYPSFTGDIVAVPEPAWDDLSSEVGFEPKGRERAATRYQARESRALYNDARLEGIGFTEPEIVTLIQGGHVAGHTVGETAQVAALKKASDYMLLLIEDGEEIEVNKSLSDDLHMFIAQPLGLRSTQFRGDQKVQFEGPEVRLDRGERFRALDARMTPYVLEAGLARIAQIEHPVLRGVTWAAFATYQQFYLDGNKRAGRFTMNTSLMSHGFDAILIPEAKKVEYEDALVDSYRSGDLTPHIRFLLSLYQDD